MDEFESESRRHQWTPPRGITRRHYNRLARKRLKVTLRRIIDAVLGLDDWWEKKSGERTQRRGDE